MELKKTIQSILTASPSTRDARVLKLKPVQDRFIVYLTSPTFDEGDTFANQYRAELALRFDPAVDPEVRRKIGLLVPLSPLRYEALLKMARKRRAAKRKRDNIRTKAQMQRAGWQVGALCFNR